VVVSDRIRLVREDITQLPVDAVVNAANGSLLGGGGVDGAIHRAAGSGLLEECRRLGGCPTGEVRVTSGHRLPARFVFHAVGPIWGGGNADEDELLASCYRNALRLSVECDVATIAFPAISCGVYGFPIPRACRIALTEIRSFLETSTLPREVWLVAFDPRVYSEYSALLRH
jgi:O-acetyl-ADP-ribose deacetylase